MRWLSTALALGPLSDITKYAIVYFFSTAIALRVKNYVLVLPFLL
jgi:hypothetical protein